MVKEHLLSHVSAMILLCNRQPLQIVMFFQNGALVDKIAPISGQTGRLRLPALTEIAAVQRQSRPKSYANINALRLGNNYI